MSQKEQKSGTMKTANQARAENSIEFSDFDLLTTNLEGIHIIEASAGTGKTYQITRIFLRLLLEKDLELEQILVVTFTRAATEELKQRIRQLILDSLLHLHGQKSLAAEDLLSRLLDSRSEQETEQKIEKLQKALRDFDEISIYTIHGFCLHVLESHAFESGMDLIYEIVEDKSEITRTVSEDIYLNLARLDTTYIEIIEKYNVNLEQVASIVNAVADSGARIPGICEASDMNELKIDESEKAELNQLYLLLDSIAREASEKVEELKERKSILLYQDYLTKLHRALHEEGTSRSTLLATLQKKFRAALIDEFQDTDSMQWDIFRTIFQNSLLFLIGDPKQSIYRFRGADIHSYIQAKNTADYHHTLKTNYRSTAGIVQAINTVFSTDPPELAFMHENLPFIASDVPDAKKNRNEDSPFSILFLSASDNEPGFLSGGDAEKDITNHTADQILSVLENDRHYSPGSIAVLVKSHAQGSKIHEALRKKNIPAVLHSEKNLFETDEAKDLYALLYGIAHLHNPQAFKKALASPLIGFTLSDIIDLEDDTYYQEVFERFAEYRSVWESEGFTRFYENILETEQHQSLSIPERILGKAGAGNGERKITNLTHLAEVLGSIDEKEIHETLRWFEKRLQGEGREEHIIRLESDSAAVQIMTIHKAKGLQFPVVFCPFLWKPGPASKQNKSFTVRVNNISYYLPHALVHPFTGPKKTPPQTLQNLMDQNENEQQAEALRLAYVSMTRSQERCYVYYGSIKGSAQSPLAHLFHNRANSQALLQELKKITQWTKDTGIAKLSAGDIPLTADVLYQDLCSNFSTTKPDRTIVIESCQNSTTDRMHVYHDKEQREMTLRAKTLGRSTLSFTPALTSYSGLISNRKSADNREYESADYIFPGKELSIETAAKENFYTIFDFPKGAAAGTFFHSILEDIDFTISESELLAFISERLEKYQYDQNFALALTKTVYATLQRPIQGFNNSTFSLAQIPAEKRLTEMQFFAPLHSFDPEVLRKGPTAKNSYSYKSIFEDMANRLNKADDGFLQGFIDLTFEHDGYYYVLDWKSNHLGDTADDYSPANLKLNVQSHLYTLQYFIYLSAMDLFLAQRIPGYQYDTHVGGVLYVYLRGAGFENAGFYYERPDQETLRWFQQSFMKGVQ